MPPILRHRNGILSIDNSELVANAVAESYLTADVASGSSTISVKNILGFGINQILLIGELGTDSAEIVLTHGSTVPSGTTVTLVTTTVKTHTTADKVRVLVYNQFELSNATTASGSKTTLTVATTADFNPASSLGSGLVAVDPTTVVQRHETSQHSSGYYFARYKNSITGDFSPYNDALAYGGWDENTVGYMIERALRDLDLTLSERNTRQDCYAWINQGNSEVKGKIKRWPEHYKDNQVIGQTSRGVNVVAMPSDIYDAETNKSIVALRVGRDTRPLRYLDPSYFDRELFDLAVTQVRTQATAGATTLEVDNSYDFDDEGTVSVFVSGTKYDITYTGVTRSASAGVLTGIPASGDGSITVTIAVDTNVYQGEIEGAPYVYTVRNGQIEFWHLADSAHDNMNIYADYNATATEVNSDGDAIDFQRFDILQPYLTWRMYCKAKLDGKLDQNSGWYLQYKERLNDAIRTLAQDRTFGFSPRINSMVKRGVKDYGWTRTSEVDPQ